MTIKTCSIVLIVISMMVYSNLIAQNRIAFYDAELFSGIVKSSQKISLKDPNTLTILRYYVGSDPKIDVALEILNNPFLNKYFSANGNASISESAKGLEYFHLKSGGPDMTKFANAIADIMIERAKQELTIAFFDRFKKYVKNNPEFQTLFPKTTENLSNLITYSYPQMLPKLRSGFLDDISQSTYNIEALFELPNYRTLLEKFPEVVVAIKSLKLIHQIENGDLNAAQIIKNFSEFEEWGKSGSLAFNNMGSTIQFAALFSESLRGNADSNRIWVSSKEINVLVNDEIFARIYLGLLYQQIKIKGIKYINPKNTEEVISLTELFAKQNDNIFLMQNRISQFISLADTVDKAYKDVENKSKTKKLTSDNYFNYIIASIDVIDYSFSIVKFFDTHLQTEDYFHIVRKSNNLYKDLYTKQYTQAISDGLDVIVKVQELTTERANPNIYSSVSASNCVKKESRSLDKFVTGVKPYAVFMGNLIEAKDEEGVKAALENAILPVGSSSIKKNTLNNISFQTYLGAYLSTSSSSNSSINAWSDKFGVTAPIGISYTPGFLSWGTGGSLSLFGALFDLGAIVDYKLKRDTLINSIGTNTSIVSKDYSIKLGQIFSPGVYAVYGFFGHIPLSLGFGAQYGPGLSKINSGGQTTIGNPSLRWNFFLAVDLPFFTLLNKNKSK